MENVQWKVEGMDCASCALTIHKYLEKQGMKNVMVNSVSGDVSFQMNGNTVAEKLVKGLDDLGYHVANQQQVVRNRQPFLSTHLQRFLFCLPIALLFCAPHVWYTYTLARKSIGTASIKPAGIYRRHELFWKKRLEKFTQWFAEYECAGSAGCHCCFCI